MNISPKYWVILPAAGIGRRLGANKPKQYLPLHGKPLIAHTIACFETHPCIQKIVVAVADNDTVWDQIRPALPHQKIMTVIGGKERYHSVYNALAALQEIAEPQDWVLVHDAVRPCLQRQEIDRLIYALKDHPVGGLLGIKIRDTLKKTDQNNQVINTLDRDNVWQAQTPQMFRYGLLWQALEMTIKNGHQITDEASAIELAGKQPFMVEGSPNNLKITYTEDLMQAEQILLAAS